MSIKYIKALITEGASDTDANWRSFNSVIPKDVIITVSDHGIRLKGDGVKNYIELFDAGPYFDINTSIAVGVYMFTSTDVILQGYLKCDGATYSKTTYAKLYAIIGGTFGETTDTFNVPNMQNHAVNGVPVFAHIKY